MRPSSRQPGGEAFSSRWNLHKTQRLPMHIEHVSLRPSEFWCDILPLHEREVSHLEDEAAGGIRDIVYRALDWSHDPCKLLIIASSIGDLRWFGLFGSSDISTLARSASFLRTQVWFRGYSLSDPDLTLNFSETSEIRETSEIYSGYLRCGNTIDSVWYNEMIEWEWFHIFVVFQLLPRRFFKK